MKYKGNSMVELRSPQKSVFDLSHERRLTAAMGKLIPINCVEALPGDMFRGNAEILLRLAPLLAPIYDTITLYVHHFFVPNRLLWDEWSDGDSFITGGRLGVGIDPVTAPVPPFINLEDWVANSLLTKYTIADYLGIPPIASGASATWAGVEIDLMPFVAYQLIWYEYYRDRNFVSDDILEFPVPSGEMLYSTPNGQWLLLRERDFLKDYYTAAQPNTQRGVEVLMPLAGTGSVSYLDISNVWNSDDSETGQLRWQNDGGTGRLGTTNPPAGAPVTARIENIDEVQLDASQVSINDFRTAYALQVWLERQQIAGSRYTETIQSHFAVRPQDSRLQRPEYIGGGRIPVKISEVVSTAYSENADTDVVPLANLAGHGVTYGNTNGFRYFATEHGFIMSIMSIMPKPSYQNGLPRMFRRGSLYDYPWPTLAKLGEQPVHKWELWFDPTMMVLDSQGNYPLFGYQSRYAEWKQAQSSNHGDFRDTLLFWTLTNDINSEPELGSAFLSAASVDDGRLFAVDNSGQNYWLYVHNSLTVKRALPYFSTPSLAN